MLKKYKKRWLEALRGDEYKQGKGKLKMTNGEAKFCCLGVLCDIVQEDMGIAWTEHKGAYPDSPTLHLFDGGMHYLPYQVSQYVGIDQTLYPINKLASLNDEGETFEFIANVIEKEM